MSSALVVISALRVKKSLSLYQAAAGRIIVHTLHSNATRLSGLYEGGQLLQSQQFTVDCNASIN